MKTSNSTRVPDEILLPILKEAKLNPLELVKLATVSKQFNRVSASNELWRDDRPEAVRRAVAEERSARGPGEDRTEFKTAFMGRMAGKSAAVQQAYRELLLQPGQRTSASRLLEIPRRDRASNCIFGGSKEVELEAKYDYDLVKHLVSQHTGHLQMTFTEGHLSVNFNQILHEPAIALAILQNSPNLCACSARRSKTAKAT